MQFNNQNDDSTSSEYYQSPSYEETETLKLVKDYNLENIMSEYAETEMTKEQAYTHIANCIISDIGGDYETILSIVKNYFN